MQTNSLAFRLVAGAALWSMAVLIAGGILLSSLFRDAVQTAFDDRLLALLESLLAVTEADPATGLELTRSLGDPRFEQAYSGFYWQIDGAGQTLRSRSLFDQALSIPGQATAIQAYTSPDPGPNGETLRVVSRAIARPGFERRFNYIIAADIRGVEAQISRFNTTLAWSLGALIVGLLTAMLVQIRFGLQPLRRLRGALVEIRHGRADRLEGRYPAEIAPLAHELNTLISHNATVVERARTQAGNLAHALKTPLSVLANETTEAEGPLADAVARQVVVMRQQIDHHLARAQAAASANILGARTPAAEVIEDLRRTLQRIHADRSIAIAATCPADLAFRGDRQDLQEMVGNLTDNACKWARGNVQIRASHNADHMEIIIEDDGPGLTRDQREQVLQRGARLDENMPGSGLGLSIVQDISELYGGKLVLGTAALGGLQARLTLPVAAPRAG
ncbi:MAG: sensor histidine kinase [Alphaproteobacteria bacterium]